MPLVHEVIFLNGFIYILKGWPVIKPGLVRKGCTRWCSQWASSPTALTSLVTNKEMYCETFLWVCVCVWHSNSLSWSATQTLSLLSFDPPCLNTSGQTVCQKPFPWQPGIPLDCVCLSFSCHTHTPFWGAKIAHVNFFFVNTQTRRRTCSQAPRSIWFFFFFSFDLRESTDDSNCNGSYM